MENEIWKDVIGYEGLYQVSNLGRVKSLERKVKVRAGGQRINKEKILKHLNNKWGYPYVIFCKNSQTKIFKIHRLVCLTFIDNPQNKPEVNHINGIKTDNNVENLEWVTAKENSKHALDNRLRKPIKGEKHHNVKLTKSQALKIKYDFFSFTLKQVAEKYGISISSVSLIRSGKTWKHI